MNSQKKNILDNTNSKINTIITGLTKMVTNYCLFAGAIPANPTKKYK